MMLSLIVRIVVCFKSGQLNNRSGGTKKLEAIFSRVLSVAENAERANGIEKRERVLAQVMKETSNNSLKNRSLRSLGHRKTRNTPELSG